jgi:hypothetical protein
MAFFLPRDMRVVAVERTRQEQIGIEKKRVKWNQVRETFEDPKTYFYVVMLFAINLANGAGSGFGSIIWRNTRCYSAMFCCLPVIAGAVMIWRSDWHKTKAVPFGASLCCLFLQEHK